jgi:hypothetical protein
MAVVTKLRRRIDSQETDDPVLYLLQGDRLVPATPQVALAQQMTVTCFLLIALKSWPDDGQVT